MLKNINNFTHLNINKYESKQPALSNHKLFDFNPIFSVICVCYVLYIVCFVDAKQFNWDNTRHKLGAGMQKKVSDVNRN